MSTNGYFHNALFQQKSVSSQIGLPILTNAHLDEKYKTSGTVAQNEKYSTFKKSLRKVQMKNIEKNVHSG